jgi:hypothetical protein
MFNSGSRNLSYAELCSEKRIFLGEDPVHAQNPGPQGHGSEIPNRSFEMHTPTDLCSKLKLSRCYTGQRQRHTRNFHSYGGRLFKPKTWLIVAAEPVAPMVDGCPQETVAFLAIHCASRSLVFKI